MKTELGTVRTISFWSGFGVVAALAITLILYLIVTGIMSYNNKQYLIQQNNCRNWDAAIQRITSLDPQDAPLVNEERPVCDGMKL